MTREEAIKILHPISDEYCQMANIRMTQAEDDICEALDMAIEALKRSETPNSSDCIDRQAAIDAVKKNTFRLTFAEEQGCEGHVAWSAEAVYSDVIEGALLELPSAQPERKKPVFKTGESVFHVSYADGTGGFEKNKWADWICPDCGWFVGEQYIPRRHNQQKCNYCAKCGCAIDWSDADMRGEQDG